MRKVSLPVVNDTDIFDNIVTAKQQPRRGLLQEIRDDVLTAYQEYEEAVPEVGSLSNVALTEQHRKALIHAYEVETAPMKGLRDELMKRVIVARCPFCGLGESSTLDHYLPKERNPQFAIFPKNLVPCCSPCNARKLDKVLDQHTDVRLFLHPYFDEIPVTLFMKIDVEMLPDAMVLTYRVLRPTDMAQRTFSQIKSHFKLLDLANRYRLMALDHLRGQYRAFKRTYGVERNHNRLAAELIEKARDFEGMDGKNNWLAVLYRTLAANDGFCNGGFVVLKRIQ